MVLKIHISLLLMLAYNFLWGNINIFFASYLFIIMHELSHMIVALLLNIDILEMQLTCFGVVAKYKGSISLIKEFFISVAGPIATLIYSYIYKDNLYFYINMCILAFNMLPIYPFDGGRILKVLVISVFGRKNGNLISSYITNIMIIFLFVLSVFVAVYFRHFYVLLISLYIMKLAKREIKKDKIINLINYLQNAE